MSASRDQPIGGSVSTILKSRVGTQVPVIRARTLRSRHMRPGVEEREEAIIDAVIGLLRTEGYDAVQVRRVATEASVSLATMYKLFGTLDEVILRAVEAWMSEHSYAALPDPAPERTPYDTLAAILRAIF